MPRRFQIDNRRTRAPVPPLLVGITVLQSHQNLTKTGSKAGSLSSVACNLARLITPERLELPTSLDAGPHPRDSGESGDIASAHWIARRNRFAARSQKTITEMQGNPFASSQLLITFQVDPVSAVG